MERGRVAYEATISSQLVSHVMEEAFTRTATYQKVIHSMITKYVLQDQTLTRQAICTLKPGQSGHRFAQEMFERLTIPSQFTLPISSILSASVLFRETQPQATIEQGGTAVLFEHLNNSNSRKQTADAAIGSFRTSEYVLASSYTLTAASQEVKRQGNASARHSPGFSVLLAIRNSQALRVGDGSKDRLRIEMEESIRVRRYNEARMHGS